MTTDEQQAEIENPSDEPVASPAPPVPSVLPPPPPQQPLVIPGQRLPYSNAQPVWQFVLLNVCTFTLYHIIWFYRNWHLLKAQRGLRVTPLVRAIFAPLFAWGFFRALRHLVGPRYYWPFGFIGPEILATIYFSLVIINYLFDFIDRETGYMGDMTALSWVIFVVGFSMMLPLIPAVRALNVYWANKQPGQPMRNSLSAGAIVIVIIGGVLLLIGLLGTILEITGQV